MRLRHLLPMLPLLAACEASIRDNNNEPHHPRVMSRVEEDRKWDFAKAKDEDSEDAPNFKPPALADTSKKPAKVVPPEQTNEDEANGEPTVSRSLCVQLRSRSELDDGCPAGGCAKIIGNPGAQAALERDAGELHVKLVAACQRHYPDAWPRFAGEIRREIDPNDPRDAVPVTPKACILAHDPRFFRENPDTGAMSWNVTVGTPEERQRKADAFQKTATACDRRFPKTMYGTEQARAVWKRAAEDDAFNAPPTQRECIAAHDPRFFIPSQDGATYSLRDPGKVGSHMDRYWRGERQRNVITACESLVPKTLYKSPEATRQWREAAEAGTQTWDGK